MRRGTGVRESVTIEALAGQVRVARAFVGGLLGAGHPCLDVAVLLAGRKAAGGCGWWTRWRPAGVTSGAAVGR